VRAEEDISYDITVLYLLHRR